MNFKRSALLALAGTLAFSAHAASTTWGTHGPLQVAATITPVGAFSDTYHFDLAGDSSLFSTAVSNNLTGVLQLNDGTVSLYRESGALISSVGSFAFSDTTGSISHAFGALTSGTYYYQVSGMSTGSMGGFYSLTSTIAAVPEPQTAAAMLVGLVAIGLLLGRRSQS